MPSSVSERPPLETPHLGVDQQRRLGEEMLTLMEELFPICRSITGNGVRQTHQRLAEHIPLRSTEVPSGTQVFDWTVPKEWNMTDGYIITPDGEKIADFKTNNLHVVGYSVPVDQRISLEELLPHLHSLPDQPDLIPYLTSYYQENWGFCLTHQQKEQLKPGEYRVVIDSTLTAGSLTYSECYLPGQSNDEVLISCYTCHPSMSNDSLSGVVLATWLAKYLSQFSLHYSYRFLFIPETIGAITWLALNQEMTHRIKAGLVATCLGDTGHLTYKRSRQGNALMDQAMSHVLEKTSENFEILDFFPLGSDERQFCSPGFNLPVGSLVRSIYGRFPQYHTSGDNLELMDAAAIGETFAKYLYALFILEKNGHYLNTNPFCEPQLGKRGIYSNLGGQKAQPETKLAIMWTLNYSDGEHSLLDIAQKADLEFYLIHQAAQQLIRNGLLVEKKEP